MTELLCTVVLFVFCVLFDLKWEDVALKEEANKKAFEKFAKELSSNCSIETVQVSERYESELFGFQW